MSFRALLKSPSLLALMIATYLLSAGRGLSVSLYESSSVGFTKDLEDLKPSLNLPVRVSEQEIIPSLRQLKMRVKRSSKDERYGPLQLSVPRSQSEFNGLVKRLARKGKEKALETRLLELLKDPNKQNQQVLRVELSIDDFKLISLRAFLRSLDRYTRKFPSIQSNSSLIRK